LEGMTAARKSVQVNWNRMPFVPVEKMVSVEILKLALTTTTAQFGHSQKGGPGVQGCPFGDWPRKPARTKFSEAHRVSGSSRSHIFQLPGGLIQRYSKSLER
jgi:hypothetical protein